jgi:hypothetical protein
MMAAAVAADTDLVADTAGWVADTVLILDMPMPSVSWLGC